MPSNLTYPGVYIEEIPSGVRTITGVSTSVTAFVGRALKGPDDKAILIHNFIDFQRIYGGLWKESYLGHVVEQYFSNGGKDALIIRVHKNANRYDYNIELGSPAKQLVLESANPGSWGKNYLIKVVRKEAELDPDDQDPTLCNIEIYENLTPNQPNPNLTKIEFIRIF